MNIEFSAFIATSLDGYIARPNGQLDWLENATEKDSKQDFGYFDFMRNVDCVVLGRNTFEKVVSFPEWSYKNQRVVVLSKTMKNAPNHLEYPVDFFSGKVELLAVELQNLGVKKAYIDGGVTIQSFINAKLLDDIIVTQIPILIGRGISLFGKGFDDVKLELLKSNAFDNGFVQSHYKFKYSRGKFFDG